jgi:hypothetical protein
LLRLARRGSRERLLIVSPWIRDAIVDAGFLRDLRRRLEAGVEVRIGYGIGRAPEEDIDERARQALTQLGADYERMHGRPRRRR